ncbi:MAG: segregation/condensation protein A, partial [Lachnospiraceae bacterium]|nr:segregation/condensation protein A [Lachnospiraceae bacterium]
FKAVMKRREDKIDPIRSKFGNIEKEDVDIEAKQTYVRLFVATHKEFSFRELLERQNSKSEIVVTFLLILEMIKIGEIEVSQESNDDDIIIVSKIAA